MTIPSDICSVDYTCFIKQMKSAGIGSAPSTQKLTRISRLAPVRDSVGIYYINFWLIQSSSVKKMLTDILRDCSEGAHVEQ